MGCIRRRADHEPARVNADVRRTKGNPGEAASGDTLTGRRRRRNLLKRRITNWKTDFPIHETVEDFSGRQRSFVIQCHEGELGYTVRASEEAADGPGYQFAAYSETSPYSALGRVRQKMSRGLATRHVTSNQGNLGMLHDTLKGRITSDGEGGVVLVVDGVPLRIEDLEDLLTSHEGWEFELRIVDALE